LDSLFVSYSFDGEGKKLAGFVKSITRELGIRDQHGESVGGGALNDAIRSRIESCDALIACLTPKSADGSPSVYVRDELQHARAKGLPAIAVVAPEARLPAGLYDEFERIELAADALDGALKLVRTIAGWRRDAGRRLQVLISPQDLAERLATANGNARCAFQTTRQGLVLRDWRDVPAWPEAGGVCAYLDGVTDDATFRLRVEIDNETWVSPHLPQWTHAHLRKT
jgi:hypothetical protein